MGSAGMTAQLSDIHPELVLQGTDLSFLEGQVHVVALQESNLKSLRVILNLWLKNLGTFLSVLSLAVFHYSLGKIGFFI